MISQNIFSENKWVVYSNITGELIGEIEVNSNGVWAKSKAYFPTKIRFENVVTCQQAIESADQNFHNKKQKGSDQEAPTLF